MAEITGGLIMPFAIVLVMPKLLVFCIDFFSKYQYYLFCKLFVNI